MRGAIARAYRDMLRVADSQALSFVVLLPGLVVLSLGTAFADTENLADFNEAWIVIAIQGFLLSVLVFGVLGFPVRFVPPGGLRSGLVLAVYGLTELARTALVESEAFDRNLIGEVNWPVQALTGLVTGVTIYSVASLTINTSHEFRSTVADLKSRTSLLQNVLARSELDANVARREILDQAKQTIRTALQKAFSTAKSPEATNKTISALLNVSDEVVRPLSRELLYRPGTFGGIQAVPVRTKLQFFEVVNLASSTEPFRPTATVVVGGILALGASVTAMPYGLGLIALIALLGTTFLLLFLAARFLMPSIRPRTPATRFVVVTLVFVLACLPSAFSVATFNGLSGNLYITFLLYSILMGVLVQWYLATMVGVRAGYALVLENLRTVNRRLEWAVARVNARLWTDQKELSRTLHNEVQGALVAAAFKLQRDLDAGKPVDIDAAAIRASVFDALTGSANKSGAPALEKALEDEQERWAGVLDISWDIDAPTFAIVNADRDARRVVVDLVSEFMTNAVKHGKATAVTMWMRPTSRGTLDISLYNNGLPYPKDRKPGLGVKLAYSISVSLRLPPRKTGVELRIEIPCELDERFDEPDSHKTVKASPSASRSAVE